MFGVVNRTQNGAELENNEKNVMYEKTYHDLISKGRVTLLEPSTTEIQK